MSEGILPRDITPEQLKAAYALNLCTVSVSQIVDYKDVCILEQEYNAILNNLNLEVIPKDDALLRTLTEILNTITFFRIQEIRKEQLDKEYQRRLKNAIWSAIPSLNVVVSNNPAVMALSLAAQVGTAYMSYRREKANAKADHERAETELEITAIEQLNALRRELFTTAWRLADAYHFPDRLRLTENQITQYDHILMDADLYRRYARLEAIAQNFAAYPPFWYNFAHTALCIALADPNPATQAQYRDKALAHFEHHRAINRFNLLREDQLTAACDLEYADLLLQSGVPPLETVYALVKDAESKAGCALDVLQLCAVAYLRIGKRGDAARLLKILVNEDFSAVSNARLLSRLYVQDRLTAAGDARTDAAAAYNVLTHRVDARYLYPMPRDGLTTPQQLDAAYLQVQRALLAQMYAAALEAFRVQQEIAFARVIPAPKEGHGDAYYTPRFRETRLGDARHALKSRDRGEYLADLRACQFRKGYLQVLNDTVTGLDELPLFKTLAKHEALIGLIRSRLLEDRDVLAALQSKLEDGSFAYADYLELTQTLSDPPCSLYTGYTTAFFEKTQKHLLAALDTAADLRSVEALHADLESFCTRHSLPAPESALCSRNEPGGLAPMPYFTLALLGAENANARNIEQLLPPMLDAVKSLPDIVKDAQKVRVSLRGSEAFQAYLRKIDATAQQHDTALAVLDDIATGIGKRDVDLLLTTGGVQLVINGAVHPLAKYTMVRYDADGRNEKLILKYYEDNILLGARNVFGMGDAAPREESYTNNAVQMESLAELLKQLAHIQENTAADPM